MRWWGFIALALLLLTSLTVDNFEEQHCVWRGRYQFSLWNHGILLFIWMLWWSAWQ